MKILDDNGLLYFWQRVKEKISKVSGLPLNSIISFEGTEDEVPEGYEVVEIGGSTDISTIVDMLYPIGRGFLDFTDTDYSNWLGLTWERELVGMFPVGYNPNDTSFDSIGEKGGEKEHTLTQAELPNYTLYNSAHSHAIYAGWGGEENGSVDDAYRFQRWALNGRDWRYGILGTNNATIKVDSGGSGQAHNNLPPYQVVSYWKRVDPNAKISFIIYNLEFQAEQGMTWQEWVNSSYNTNEFYISGNFVYSKANKSISSVKPTDVIISGKTYYYNSEK